MEPKPSWLFNQSAVIPFRRTGETVEILLITSRKRKRWIIPKGVIEPGLTPEKSAMTEAWEEAGIRGRIHGGPMGEYDYDKWGGTCHVRVYLFEVTEELDEWPESSMRDRKWLTVKNAASLVGEDALRPMIADVPKLI